MLTRLSKLRLIAASAGSVVALGIGGAPAPAAQEGLVNVELSNNTVQVPVGVAANICGVAVNLIARETFTGNTLCESASRSRAIGGGGGGGGGTEQSGLINVALVGNTVQVPIGIAANVCGVTANVIAQETFTESSTCKSVSRVVAEEPEE